MGEWKSVTLGEISIDISYGYTASATQEKNGPKFLRITDIVPDRIDWDSVPYCLIEDKKLKQYTLKYGDIVIARTGATTGYNKLITGNDNAIFASYLIRYKINIEVANPYYVAYNLQSYEWKGFVEGIIGGSAQPGANAKQFASFDFLLPSLKEQKAIAQVLSSLDDKIDLLHRQNKTLEEMAQTLFRQWFVEEAKEGWEITTLGSFGKAVTGKTPSTKNSDYWGEEISFITPTDFKYYGKYSTFSDRSLSIAGMEKVKNSVLPKDSILVTCIGSDMGKVAIVQNQCVTNQQINSLIINDPFTLEYVYQHLKYSYPLLRAIAMGGTTMPIINKTDFENIEIPLPTNDLIKKFHNITSSFNEKIIQNTNQIKTLENMRDTLLPKLMSKEIRIKDL